jgi:four helix bundle protein
MSERAFDLEDRLLDFAARIIRVSESMKQTPAGRHVGDQLLRSGTSPFANHGEAEGAESLNDFIHKLRICYKELRESRRWMRLAHRADLLEQPERLTPLLDEADELIRIFAASLRTAEKKRDKNL